MPDPSWLVLHCTTGTEAAAAHALTTWHDVSCYVPELVRGAGRTAFFPGYFFAQAALLPTRAFATLPGHAHPLTFAGARALCPPAVLAGVRADLARLNGGRFPARLQVGEPVVITAGPLTGLDAVVLATLPAGQRVQVLVAFLGGPHPATIPARHLARRDRGAHRHPAGPAKGHAGA